MFWKRVHNNSARSLKVVDSGTNRKRVWDLLLVVNSNLGHISPHFRDITGFLLRRATPPPSPISPEFWECFPWTRLQMFWLRGALIIHVVTFELIQTICPWYLHVTNRQTGDLRVTITVTALYHYMHRAVKMTSRTHLRPTKCCNLFNDYLCHRSKD